jgi:hypothetical protein
LFFHDTNKEFPLLPLARGHMVMFSLSLVK